MIDENQVHGGENTGVAGYPVSAQKKVNVAPHDLCPEADQRLQNIGQIRPLPVAQETIGQSEHTQLNQVRRPPAAVKKRVGVGARLEQRSDVAMLHIAHCLFEGAFGTETVAATLPNQPHLLGYFCGGL
jgi:hypothetical protein